MAEGESQGQAGQEEGNKTVSGFQNQGGEVKISTQTPEGGSQSGAGDGKPEGDGAEGTGKPAEGEGSGEGEGADTYAPDADGKFTHPETKAKVDAPEMVKYLADKFSASSKGAQDLLTEKGTLTTRNTELEGTVSQLTKDIEELRKVAEGKNPEGLKLFDLQGQLTKTTEELALLKEKGSLDDFEKQNPLATGKLRDSLKALARSNPKESLQKLWDDNLKAGAEAAESKRKSDEEKRKKGAGDKGEGTSTREPAGGGNTVRGNKGDTGLTLEEFNKLSVKERRDLIVKFDIRG